MADQPQHHTAPCLHIDDVDGAQLAVHHRGDKATGFYLETRAILPFMGLPIDARVGVYLTQAQAHELIAYFRAEL